MLEYLGDNLFRIPLSLPGSPLKLLNVYLIRGEERHLLIDTGFNRPECREGLLEAFEELGVSVRDMDIFVTHLHADHCGLVSSLAQEGQTVYVSPRDAGMINDMTEGDAFWTPFLAHMRPHGITEALAAELMATHPAVLYADRRRVPQTFVDEGVTLEYGGRTLRVIDAAGHTPGQLCLFDPARRELFSADHILGGITPNIAWWPGVSDSLGTYLRNLDAADLLGSRRMFPGHRALIDNPRERIAELKAHHAERLNEVLGILRATGPASAFTVASRMHWSIRAVTWEGFPAPQKWFACGEALAHLDHLAARGLVAAVQTADGSVVYAPTTAASAEAA